MMNSEPIMKGTSARRCTGITFGGEAPEALKALTTKPWTYNIQIMPVHGSVTAMFEFHEMKPGEYFSTISASIWISSSSTEEGKLSVSWTVASFRDGSGRYGQEHKGRTASIDEAHAHVVELIATLRTLPTPSTEQWKRLSYKRAMVVYDAEVVKAVRKGPGSFAWEDFVRHYGHTPGTPHPDRANHPYAEEAAQP